MSYVRFSTDGFRSDVYAYESNRGYEIHVASVRYSSFPSPAAPLPGREANEAALQDWADDQRRYHQELRKMSTAAIADEHAGGHYTFDDLDDLLGMLYKLKRRGFQVPDSAFSAIEAEIRADEEENAFSRNAEIRADEELQGDRDVAAYEKERTP